MSEEKDNTKGDLKLNKEEVDIMPTAVKIINDERIYAQQMRAYVEKLEEQAKHSKEDAKKEAKKALIATGVINENGSSKTKIVSWE